MIDDQLRDWPFFRRQLQPKLIPQSPEDRWEIFRLASVGS